jgi:hypothetical protein
MELVLQKFNFFFKLIFSTNQDILMYEKTFKIFL